MTLPTTLCGRCGAENDGSPAACPSCGGDPLVAGRYVLLGVLGRGGTGVTWKARRHPDGAIVCLKELRWDRMGSLKDEELFHREAAILKTLRHPQIPAYLDDFAWPEEPGPRMALWLAQEFVDGQSLETERQSRRYRVDDVLAIGEQIGAVLASLGEERPPVVHRDLKPGNLMRRRDGTLLLVDFGAARAAGLDGDGGASLSGAATVAGTFGFMAPEQLRGEASPASDVYGLAMTLASLLAGTAPEALLDEANRPDLARIAGLAPSLRTLLADMLAPTPNQRPSARAVTQRIRALRRGDVPASTPDTRVPLQAALATRRARNPAQRIITLTVFFAVLGIFAWVAVVIFGTVSDITKSAERALPRPTTTREAPPQAATHATVVIAKPPNPTPDQPPPHEPQSVSPEALAKARADTLTKDNQGCRSGEREACTRLWDAYVGADKDAVLALGLPATLASACDQGDGASCGLRGTLSMDGAGVPESRADGRSWYVRACDAGHVATCALSGRMLVDGDAGAIDAKRGVAQLQKACDAADEVACMNIGVALARGQGIPADRPRALAIFEKACKSGQSLACKNLDGLVGNDWGLPSEPKARFALLARLCDQRIGTACARAGDAAKSGRGTARDPALATDYKQRACNLGVEGTCAPTP